MPKQVPERTAAELEPAPPRSTITNWSALKGVRPISFRCESYQEFHTNFIGCHTKLPADPKTLAAHTSSHGGGFVVELEEGNDGGVWEKMASEGLEVVDFRCDVCGTRIKPIAPAVIKHLVSHQNRNKVMEMGGRFKVTLAFQATVDDEME